MLTDVLVHQLDHHHDRMTSRGGRAARGDPYTEQYARRVRADVAPKCVQRFGDAGPYRRLLVAMPDQSTGSGVRSYGR